MITYETILLAQAIAAERTMDKRRREYRPRRRPGGGTLRSLVRALMSWLF